AALSRYARRAAFRPTPAGLLAGVAMGRLGSRTRLATNEVEPVLAPTWERVAALGRALLDEPEIRPGVSLRIAPSLMAAGARAVWLGLGHDGLEVRSSDVDVVLEAVIAGAQDWTPWEVVGKAVEAAVSDEAGDVDELLLVLVDRGVLCHDLAPPIVGQPPAQWLAQRLARFPAEVDAVVDPIRQGLLGISPTDLAGTRAALAGLPGASESATDVMGTLRHCPRGEPMLSQQAVARAAACAPLLLRLQEALAGPVAERVCDAGLAEQLDSMVEVFGAGALDLADLATGGYGSALAEIDDEPARGDGGGEVLALLADAVAQAAAAGEVEITLDPAALDAILPAVGTPPTFELFLSPAREPPRARPGTGWLLGLHAPGGASWGRFAGALDAPMREALAELAAAEKQARPGERALDVVYAPSPALADLCAHPPVREAALALVGWPEGAALTPAELALVADPAAAEPLALRDSTSQPIAPSPLHRVRSATAPSGIYRLLAGWSFARQQAPWAFSWGALAGLTFLPRVVLDGFVVSPASWRVPSPAQIARPTALARWRRQNRVPAAVQAGQGDELLYLDLRAAGACAELARFAGGRVFEIWPPLDALPDEGGRRVEAVVAVAHVPDGAEIESLTAAIEATRAAGRVPPPAQAPPAEHWVSFRIYGAVERQDAVLFEAVGPAVKAALDAGEIDAWFFLPYLDQAGRRHHLRVRGHAGSERKAEAFAGRVRHALAPLCSRGDVVRVETGGYFREAARYGGAALMPAVERLFQSSSELVLAVLEAEDQGTSQADRVALAVRAADAMASGVGLDLAARMGLARRCREACAHVGLLDEEHARQEYRKRSRGLFTWLAGQEDDGFTPALASLKETAASVAESLDADLRLALRQKLPVLLHVQDVRLAGANLAAEALAHYLWHRTVEGIAARRRY
ncbi:MAG TPA: thiopeptide-type bacteriocin biosynthesis protein, partial [Polyangia bacterium]|nr:thiopeptide-type bacteriocin biosynthesis protein [Polyangia bacterium]